MKVAIELSVDQLNLIADLVSWERYQISGDIEEEEDSDLRCRQLETIHQLETIYQLLNAYQNTLTTAN